MPNTSPAEFVLALIAGHDRAAAILGDLTEMAQTRGRLWFFAAYLRTLFTFTWRIVLAFFCGSTALIGISVFPLWFHRASEEWRFGSHLLNLGGPLLLDVVVSLGFAVPYCLVRYGVRDRLAKLGLVLLLFSTLAYLLPWLSLAFIVITAAAIVSRSWRKPMIAIAAIIATGSALQTAVGKVDRVILNGHEVTQDGFMMVLFYSLIVAMLAAAIICSLLHRWLRKPANPPSAEAPTGAAHA
jgi:hypothetical protein